VPKDLQLQGLALMTAGASGIAQIACPADPGLAAWHVARLASNRAISVPLPIAIDGQSWTLPATWTRRSAPTTMVRGHPSKLVILRAAGIGPVRRRVANH
jgi:hypothetical protein